MFCEFLFLHHHPAAGQERHTRDDAPHLSERETCIRFYNLYTFCVYVFLYVTIELPYFYYVLLTI